MKNILTLLLIVSCLYNGISQNRSLFNHITNPTISNGERDHLDHLKEMYGNEQRIVTVDIEAIKMNTEIYIRGFGGELTFRADRIHSPNESNWYASLISTDGHTGSISNSDGILFGELHDEISSYNLSPLSNDPNDERYVITKHIFNGFYAHSNGKGMKR
jgi:hypothetical protein